MPADPDASPDRQSTVLVLPPTRADADAMRKLLAGSDISCAFYVDMSGLCDALAAGAGAVVVSEEALLDQVNSLAECVRSQPVWSDIPVIVLSRSGAESLTLARAVERIGNASVIERPVRMTTLVSLLRSALRARYRQYQVRDHLLERDRAGRMKDEFLATLSHELRTPLNAILGWSQLLRTTPDLTEEVAEGLETIERNARVQTQIVEDLLDMSRIIAGNVRMEIQRVDVATVLKAAVDTVGPTAQARGVVLKLTADTPAPPVNGDPGRLQQVFWNLLTNAVKFTPTGGFVTASIDTADGDVVVTVVDTGDGIDSAFLPYVFDRFRQADSTSTRRHGGLGLGLSIVKQLAELHGGTIAARSDGRGKGSTFRVTLPIATTEPAKPAVGSTPAKSADVVPAAARPDHVNLSDLNVLVIDDEPDARQVMRRLLEEHDAVVSTAADVDAALTAVSRDRPDVLVSDIGMPGQDGYDLIRRLRALPPDQGGNTPAIAVTAYARAEDRARAIAAGFQSHLVKPVDATELVSMLSKLARR